LTGWATVTVITAGAVVALSVLLDKVADRYSARLQGQVGIRAVVAIETLVDDVQRIAKFESAARLQKVVLDLPVYAVQTAVNAAVAGSDRVRATYYPLTYDSNGMRELRNPVNRGRSDAADQQFLEATDPTNTVWETLDRADSNCQIRREKADPGIVNWSSKPYKTFVSVPVRTDAAVYGMLSVNASQEGDLTELDRLVAVCVARVMAAAQSLVLGARGVRERIAEADEARSRRNVSP
jgi:hypothetical protein